ncbi:CRISPR-associated endonuclease Cas2 [Haematomicrobium sanguinis]|uniref:CRISPR-associated endonuclease Cas2 n=1 Tax=Haematomicrobium sanguinis TaxID=479106 RepID=UPI000478E383
MSESPRRYLIAYDIKDDKRRSKVATYLQSFGDRIQYSVFIIDVRPSRLVRVDDELKNRIKLSEDRILICNLGLVGSITRDVFRFIGNSKEIEEGPIVL